MLQMSKIAGHEFFAKMRSGRRSPIRICQSLLVKDQTPRAKPVSVDMTWPFPIPGLESSSPRSPCRVQGSRGAEPLWFAVKTPAYKRRAAPAIPHASYSFVVIVPHARTRDHDHVYPDPTIRRLKESTDRHGWAAAFVKNPGEDPYSALA